MLEAILQRKCLNQKSLLHLLESGQEEWQRGWRKTEQSASGQTRTAAFQRCGTNLAPKVSDFYRLASITFHNPYYKYRACVASSHIYNLFYLCKKYSSYIGAMGENSQCFVNSGSEIKCWMEATGIIFLPYHRSQVILVQVCVTLSSGLISSLVYWTLERH